MTGKQGDIGKIKGKRQGRRSGRMIGGMDGRCRIRADQAGMGSAHRSQTASAKREDGAQHTIRDRGAPFTATL